MPHPWPVFTPEDNHTALTRLGTGSATTLAYHAAVTAQVANLESIGAASAVSAAGTYGVWQGAGSLASMAAQSGLNSATTALGAWLAQKLPLVASTVSAYHSAAASMVPAEAAVANRVEEATDEQINPLVWGALTPRIVALNLDYFGHMWPRNAAAGAAYGAVARASAAAMLAVPPPPALAGGSVAAPAAAAATIAEDGGVSAAGTAMRAGAQTAEAVIAPAAAAPQLAARAAAPAPVVGVPVAGLRAPVGAASSAPVGMFAPLSAAALPAPAVATAQTEVAETVAAPRGGTAAAPVGVGHPGAGMTSYLRPADGFSSPPAGGRATGLKPGILNAAALRGPLSNAPTGTAQPLAYSPAAAPAMLGFGPGQAPLDPTTTTTTPTTTAPMPDCDLDEVAKLHRKVDDLESREANLRKRIDAFNKLPHDFDANDPAQVKAAADYEAKRAALVKERDSLTAEEFELRNELIRCGIKIYSKNGQEIIEWPDGSTAPTPTPSATRPR